MFFNFKNNISLSVFQIALFRLGAPMEQIKEYTVKYIPKLEVKGGPRHLKDDSLVESYNSIEELLGKNSRYNFSCFSKQSPKT